MSLTSKSFLSMTVIFLTLIAHQAFAVPGDVDNDGYRRIQGGVLYDCNDRNAAIYPGATETCNSLDDDCDGFTDEEVTITYYQDADSDGYGNLSLTTTSCSTTAPSGYSSDNTDCDDTVAAINPLGTEVCDALDNDCSGTADDGITITYYLDDDGDGYGMTDSNIVGDCAVPEGYATADSDCDDTDTSIHPSALDICGDRIDQDCNELDRICNPNRLATGRFHSCFIQSDNSVVCWGKGGSGQLGDNNGGVHTVTSPAVGSEVVDSLGISLDNMVSITAGAEHTCAFQYLGAGYCWGNNAPYGQLGQGTNTGESAMALEVPPSSGNPYVTMLTTGFNFSCAMEVGGQLECWGNPQYGALGNGTTLSYYSPTDVLTLDGTTESARDMNAGGYHTCALVSDGQVMCWGYDQFGQVGNGVSGIDEESPVYVNGIGASSTYGEATQVAAGTWHSCAVISSGEVYCWGSNTYGQLGNGYSGSSYGANYEPSLSVSGVSDATNIAIGYRHSCVLHESGTVSCWGNNTAGELGNNSTSLSATPVTVVDNSLSALSNVIEIATSYQHSCALKSDGTVWCWGYNNSGQLGNGTSPTNSAVAVEVVF